MGLGHTSIRRSILGFVVAPPLGVAAYVLTYFLIACVYSAFDRSMLASTMFYSMVVLVMGPIIAFVGLTVVGIPSWLFLRRFDLESSYAYALIGAAGGFFVPTAKIDHFMIFSEPSALHNAAAGGLVMLVFWSFAKSRPQKN